MGSQTRDADTHTTWQKPEIPSYGQNDNIDAEKMESMTIIHRRDQAAEPGAEQAAHKTLIDEAFEVIQSKPTPQTRCWTHPSSNVSMTGFPKTKN